MGGGGGRDGGLPRDDEEAEQGLKGRDEQVQVSFESVPVPLDDDFDEAAEPWIGSLGRVGFLGHRWPGGADRGHSAQCDLNIPLLHGLLFEYHLYRLGDD